MLSEKLQQIPARHSANTAFTSQDRLAQAMSSIKLLKKRIVSKFLGRLIHHADFLQDHFTLTF